MQKVSQAVGGTVHYRLLDGVAYSSVVSWMRTKRKVRASVKR